jgi:excisionase family DNA binding protein
MLAEKRSKLLTADEVAEYAGLHPESVRRLARAGRIPGRKFGGEWRFRFADVERSIFGDEEDATT